MSVHSLETRVTTAAPALSRSQVKRIAKRLAYLEARRTAGDHQAEQQLRAALRAIGGFDPTGDAAATRATVADPHGDRARARHEARTALAA